MAVANDWKEELVNEICVFRDDSKFSSNVRAAIDRLVPMKDGVAYMPVPRCETCEHWIPYPDNNDGICQMMPGSLKVSVGGTTWTDRDFGCVEWQEKAE